MRVTAAAGAIICYCVTFAACALAGDKREAVGVLRESLYYMKLPDGSELSIRAPPVPSSGEPATIEVKAVLFGEGMAEIWVARNVTSMRFPQDSDVCYALVKVMEDRLFIFFIWNRQHCTIAKKSGAVLSRGEGDDALKRYDQLVPLKLTTTSTFRRVPFPEGKGKERQDEAARR